MSESKLKDSMIAKRLIDYSSRNIYLHRCNNQLICDLPADEYCARFVDELHQQKDELMTTLSPPVLGQPGAVNTWEASMQITFFQLKKLLELSMSEKQASQRAYELLEPYREEFEERFAIMEVDGGVPREEAQRMAWERVFNKRQFEEESE